jgi:hypothetical protein
MAGEIEIFVLINKLKYSGSKHQADKKNLTT